MGKWKLYVRTNVGVRSASSGMGVSTDVIGFETREEADIAYDQFVNYQRNFDRAIDVVKLYKD